MEDTPLYSPPESSEMDSYSPDKAWLAFLRLFLAIDILVLVIGILFFSPLSNLVAQLFDPVLHAWGDELEQIRQGWMQFVRGFWGMVPVVLLGQMMLVTALYRGNLSDLADVPLRGVLFKVLCAQFLSLVAYFVLVENTTTFRELEYPIWTTMCLLCTSVLTVITVFRVIFDMD